MGNLRPVDTGETLINPWMGWALHYYDNDLTCYGAQLRPADTLEDFPGLSVLYLRLPWCYLEPEEGQFCWAVLDTPAQRWLEKGRRIALRVTSLESCETFATPQWVKDAGARFRPIRLADGKVDCENPDVWEPIYDDPVYLEKLEHFMMALSKRYNGRPDVEFVDVGTVGVWGEGHNWSLMSPSVYITHIDLHCKYFTGTPLVVNDDFTYQGAKPILHALEKNLWLRDDSILVEAPPHEAYQAFMANEFWPTRPVILEKAHYNWINREDHGWWNNGEHYLDVVERYHASYVSIHHWPREFLEKEYQIIERINRRLGYRLNLIQAQWPDEVPIHQPFSVCMTWANAGVAPCYCGGHVALTLKDREGGITGVFVDESFDVRSLGTGPAGTAPSQTVRLSFRFPVNQQPGEFDLYLSVGDALGCPTIALPLADTDGQRRYRLGRIRLTAAQTDGCRPMATTEALV